MLRAAQRALTPRLSRAATIHACSRSSAAFRIPFSLYPPTRTLHLTPSRNNMAEQAPAPAPAPASAPPADVPLDEHGQPLSKSALKKLEKEREKAKKKAEREAKEAAERKAREAAEVDDAAQNYGKAPLNQSQERPGRQFTHIQDINASMVGQKVLLQARVHNSRAQSAKMCFVVFRQQTATVQSLLSVSPSVISKQMVKFASRLPFESIVLVEGEIQKPLEPVKTCSVQDAEIKVEKLYVVSEAPAQLPFSLEDASRPTQDMDSASAEGSQHPTVNFDTRLDNRVLDLRTPVNQAIFRIQAKTTSLFRSFLDSQGFLEIHTPKLQGAATESGATVFKVDYFDGRAFLAQSPQLAKQMAIAADLDRVYEVGPVFRAENSNTARHMTEFTGLDLEMALKEHYHEVLDLLDSLFIHIFKGLQSACAAEIETVKSQFPHDDFRFLEQTLRLEHKEAVRMLREAGHEIEFGADMSTPQEKALGELVRQKYDTDYYIIDKFPLAIRPFYTMPDPNDPTLSNSYDFFMRGEEIISGAQRIHDPTFLAERMRLAGVDPASMKGYVDAFALGCPPHAGGGIGMERVVMLFLKLGNIRRASMFPRDPRRLEP